MIDNLRRTLSAPSMFLTLLAGWLVPNISPWVWTKFILSVISIPSLIPFLAGLNPRLRGHLEAELYPCGVVGSYR